MLDDLDHTDIDGLKGDPPPTKTVGQSVLAMAVALVLGTGAVSLLLIHSVASGFGVLVWIAATVVPGIISAIYVAKNMDGYHN